MWSQHWRNSSHHPTWLLRKTLSALLDMKTLNANEKQSVTYCIPLWLRDEQIKLAIERVKGRIEPSYDKREEPAAIVCYGPSLNQTWEQIKDFKYIFTCSGSHKFLLERELIPTWHVEVDPRSHKIGLLGPPHPDVTYLPASTCHPNYFKHLEGYNIKLWHVFDSQAEAFRVLPPGEWAVTGGCDVGLRALTLAAFLGFRDLHIFGMDGCFGDTGRHAAAHPNQGKHAETEYEGKIYHTTPAMLACTQQLLHELDQLPGVEVKLYGEGLAQAMFRNYIRKIPNQPKELIGSIAVCKPDLISTSYVELNAQLHRENLAYGVGGERHALTVLKLAESLKTKNILDYGCGKGRLAKSIPWQIAEYDPAISGKQESPKPADIVICTDVLEHIEPDKILYVLDDLRRCTQQVGFFVIHTQAAQKTLSDGRNTHLIQQSKDWWEKKLNKFFKVGKIMEVGPELYVVVGPKTKIKTKEKAA